MKKAIFFLSIIVAAFVSGCASGPGIVERNEGKGVVIMPVFYEEVAPHKGILGVKELKQHKYFTSAVFKNISTGKTVQTGVELAQYEPERYLLSGFEPGYYELISFSIGGLQTPYDSQKCGKMSFSINANDAIVLKGPRPAAITETVKGLLNIRSRHAAYPQFTNLPADHEVYIRANYKELLQTRKLKVVELTSNNPVAYSVCVKSVRPSYPTLMIEENAVSMLPR